MDNFINLAKKGYEAYSDSQQQGHSGGGEGDQVQDRRHHEAQAIPNLDHDEVVNHANANAEGSGDSSLFSSAMKHISGNNGEHTKDIDEGHVTRSHEEAYEKNNAGGLDAGSMGAAAAMQAFKMFTSGKASSSGAGGGGSSQLVSLAMGEAAKLFDSSGGAKSGGKQDVVNGAAMTMMKLVVKSKMGGGGTVGGGNSGGLGQLMGLAKNFL